MAGLGYRSFVPGEILTSSNLQGYAVDQSTMVFASSAARTTALAAPSQGMVSWLNDSGTAWQYFELYNASSNPGGAVAAGWYAMPGNGLFAATATKSSTNNVAESIGASGFAYTEITDTVGWHNAVTNPDRITPTIAGVYRVTASLYFAANVTGNRRLQILKNGSTVLESRTTGAVSSGANLSHIVSMNGSSDYITLTSFQDSGGALTVTVAAAVEFLRPATA